MLIKTLWYWCLNYEYLRKILDGFKLQLNGMLGLVRYHFFMNPTSILLPWRLPLDLDTFLWERTNYLKNEGECVHLRVAWTVSPGSRGTWYWTILTWAPYLIAGRFCTRNNVVCLTYRSTRSDWVWLKVNQWFHPKIFIRWLRQKKSPSLSNILIYAISRTLATFCEFTIIYNTIKTVLWLRLEKKICGFMMRWWVWPDKCWATLFYCIFLKYMTITTCDLKIRLFV